MLRRAALVTFASAVVLAAACGHQVTPSPSAANNNLTGSMLIRFRTAGPFKFDKYDYSIVINTCGGGTPYPNVYATTFLNYTFSFDIGTTRFAAATNFPVLVQYLLRPGTSNQLNPTNVTIQPTEYTFNPNSNGQGNEFTLTFPRGLLADPLGTSALPCNNPLLPGGTATTAPSVLPTTQAQSRWAFNFFVVDPVSQRALDSLGVGGPTDNTYTGAVVDTTTTNVKLANKQPTISGGPSDSSAQLASGEIDNTL